jgi:hypothetical protein
MRSSLQKTAHAALSSAASRKSGYARDDKGESGAPIWCDGDNDKPHSPQAATAGRKEPGWKLHPTLLAAPATKPEGGPFKPSFGLSGVVPKPVRSVSSRAQPRDLSLDNMTDSIQLVDGVSLQSVFSALTQVSFRFPLWVFVYPAVESSGMWKIFLFAAGDFPCLTGDIPNLSLSKTSPLDLPASIDLLKS